MSDNFELARTYRASFSDKSVVVRVGRADVETPGTPEVERFKGEASMWYLAHALIREGVTLSDLDNLFLVAVQGSKPLLKSESEQLRQTLVRALTFNLN